MVAFSLIVAFSFTSTEQQIIGWALVLFSTLSALGFAMYKVVHLAKENWAHVESGGKNVVDFYYDRRTQIIRRRAELGRARQDLSGGLRVKRAP